MTAAFSLCLIHVQRKASPLEHLVPYSGTSAVLCASSTTAAVRTDQRQGAKVKRRDRDRWDSECIFLEVYCIWRMCVHMCVRLLVSVFEPVCVWVGVCDNDRLPTRSNVLPEPALILIHYLYFPQMAHHFTQIHTNTHWQLREAALTGFNTHIQQTCSSKRRGCLWSSVICWRVHYTNSPAKTWQSTEMKKGCAG